MEIKPFPQSREYELELLKASAPEFERLREYLEPYLRRILDTFECTQETYDQLYYGLVADIKIAAEKYLTHRTGKEDYKFSSYYSWFVGERLKKYPSLKHKTS